MLRTRNMVTYGPRMVCRLQTTNIRHYRMLFGHLIIDIVKVEMEARNQPILCASETQVIVEWCHHFSIQIQYRANNLDILLTNQLPNIFI